MMAVDRYLGVHHFKKRSIYYEYNI